MQKDPAKPNGFIAKIGGKNLLIGLTILLLVGIYYFVSKKNDREIKTVPEQATSNSADSVIIEKLSNQDTITSLQDPIDTTKQKH